jgi:hypothetical protein
MNNMINYDTVELRDFLPGIRTALTQAGIHKDIIQRVLVSIGIAEEITQQRREIHENPNRQ